MATFNQVTLMGNITRDPQLKQLPSNTVVAEFGIDTDRGFANLRPVFEARDRPGLGRWAGGGIVYWS